MKHKKRKEIKGTGKTVIIMIGKKKKRGEGISYHLPKF